MRLLIDDSPWWPDDCTAFAVPVKAQVALMPGGALLRWRLLESVTPDGQENKAIGIQMALDPGQMRQIAEYLLRGAQALEQAKNASN